MSTKMLNQCFAFHKNGQKPRKTAARDVGNTSLKNFSFSPLKGFVMIADHMYIHYNNPETKGRFNNVAVFTVKRDLCYVDNRYFFSSKD